MRLVGAALSLPPSRPGLNTLLAVPASRGIILCCLGRDTLADWCFHLDLHRELHVFRGIEPAPAGFIMGHEFTGTIVQAGDNVKTVKVGDKIVCPFTISWYVV